MGNDIEWISKISTGVDEGKVRGPRIVYVGNALDASPPVMEHHIGLDDLGVAARAVELLHSRGASAIKVREKITPELLRSIADKAHQLGIPVTGHLMRTDAREAALAGIDGLEHATGIVQALAGRPRQSEPGENPVDTFISDFEAYSTLGLEKIEELVQFLASHNVSLIPTMSDLSRLVREHGDDFACEDAEYGNNPSLSYVPEPIRKMWQTSYFFKTEKSERIDRAHEGYKRHQQLLLSHYKAGAKVLAGTDTFFSVPGLTLLRELSVLVEAGFSTGQAISIATHDNAGFLGRSAELGTIAAGKIADIMVVDADPLADIRNLRQLSTVIKDGQVVDLNYHPDYSTPTPKPKLNRPLWLEQQLHGSPRS
jgi:hypothetical protein